MSKRSIADLTQLSTRLAETCRFLSTVVHGGIVGAQQVIDIAKAGVAEIHDELLETCGSTRKYYASAPMRTAAVVSVMDGRNKSAVFKIYTDLVQEHFTDMPLSSQALIRQVNSGKATANDGSDTLARGLKVFNPDNKDITRVQCSEADVASAREFTRAIIKKSLTAHG